MYIFAFGIGNPNEVLVLNLKILIKETISERQIKFNLRKAIYEIKTALRGKLL